MPRLTPPTDTTFIISFVLFVLGVAGVLAPGSVPIGGLWALMAGYIVLAAGVLIRGI